MEVVIYIVMNVIIIVSIVFIIIKQIRAKQKFKENKKQGEKINELLGSIRSGKGNPNAKLENGLTLLMSAIKNCNAKIAIELLKHGADPLKPKIQGYKPIHAVCMIGHVELTREILKRGEDIETRDREKRTPLLLASYSGFFELVRFLLESGADLSAKDNRGYDAVTGTAMHGASEDFKPGETELEYAYVLRVLKDFGADLDSKDNEWKSPPLAFAISMKKIQMIKTLLDLGVRTSETDRYGVTSPVYAEKLKDRELINMMKWADEGILDQWKDVDSRFSNGETALMIAADNGLIERVKELIKMNADTSLQDNDGLTALAMAARSGCNNVLKTLLENDRVINVRDKQGKTALIHASAGGYSDLISILIEAGADVHATDNYGNNAVLVASKCDHPYMTYTIKALLAHGAQPDIQNPLTGESPLMRAAHEGYPELVELLLEAGASRELKSKNGKTAMDYARKKEKFYRKHGNFEFVTYYQEVIKQLEHSGRITLE